MPLGTLLFAFDGAAELAVFCLAATGSLFAARSLTDARFTAGALFMNVALSFSEARWAGPGAARGDSGGRAVGDGSADHHVDRRLPSSRRASHLIFYRPTIPHPRDAKILSAKREPKREPKRV